MLNKSLLASAVVLATTALPVLAQGKVDINQASIVATNVVV